MTRRILLAAGAGLALALAFEPVAQAWLVPLAVAGFVLSVRGLGPRAAALPGLAFGIAFWFVLTVWMRSVGTDAWIGMATFFALFHAVQGSATALLQRLRGWPLWVACAWVAVEVWHTEWPWSGMPWGRLAFAVVDTPVAAALAYVGSAGVSLALALLGSLLAWAVVRVAAAAPAVRRRALAPALAPAVVLAVLVCLPALAPYQAEQTGRATIAVVQGDVPGPDGNDILLDFRQVTRNHVDATVDLARRVEAGEVPEPDLVVWPENSTAVDPFRDEQTNAGIEEASRAIGVPILVGAIVDGGPGEVLNQGIVWDPVTGPGDRYSKRHPVVFGEFIPFRSQLQDLQIGRLTMVGRDMLAGTRDEPLRIGDLRVADAICFDVAYDDGIHAQVENGAQLLTVQTSNATFTGSRQLDQQFAITRLRAIETGRWVAVASPNGISGIIAPDGTVVDRAPLRSTDVMVQEITLAAGVPLAVRLGPWPGLGALGVALLALGVAVLSYRRRRDPPADPEREAEPQTGAQPGAGDVAPQRVSEPA